MNKRVVAAIGMLLLGYLVKVFLENIPGITGCVSGYIITNPVTLRFIAGGLVITVAFTILYGLIKVFLNWQDPDSDKSEPFRKG